MSVSDVVSVSMDGSLANFTQKPANIDKIAANPRSAMNTTNLSPLENGCSFGALQIEYSYMILDGSWSIGLGIFEDVILNLTG